MNQNYNYIHNKNIKLKCIHNKYLTTNLILIDKYQIFILIILL